MCVPMWTWTTLGEAGVGVGVKVGSVLTHTLTLTLIATVVVTVMVAGIARRRVSARVSEEGEEECSSGSGSEEVHASEHPPSTPPLTHSITYSTYTHTSTQIIWLAYTILVLIIVAIFFMMISHNPLGEQTVIKWVTTPSLRTHHTRSITTPSEELQCSPPTMTSLIGAYYNSNTVHTVSHLRGEYFTSLVTQQLFDQGLLLLHGFNQFEAIRNFEAALATDPLCYLCHWGIAQSSRTNLNNRMRETMYLKGKWSITEALAIYNKLNRTSVNTSPDVFESKLMKMLLSATALSFGTAPVMSFSELDVDDAEAQYSMALRNIYHLLETQESDILNEGGGFSGFGFAADVGIFLAESLLNLTPWKYYDVVAEGITAQHTGGVRYEVAMKSSHFNSLAQEAFEIFQSVLCSRQEPHTSTPQTEAEVNKVARCNHPLGLHLYIHLVEQMDNPQLGIPEAMLLANIMKQSPVGHLLHMPAHIYLRTGKYTDCISASQSAILNDQHLESNCLNPYFPGHNVALLVMCSLYSGDSELALSYSEPVITLRSSTARGMNSMYPVPQDLIYLHFGQYQKVLEFGRKANFTLETPKYLQAIYYYAQVLAIHRSPEGQTSQGATKKLRLFDYMARNIPHSHLPIDHQFYSYQREMGQLMNLTIYASLAIGVEDYEGAVSILHTAVELQDSFSYMEPENYYFPMRQCLGGAMFLQYLSNLSYVDKPHDDLRKIEKIYQDDLRVHPNNYWTLKGLQRLKTFTDIIDDKITPVRDASKNGDRFAIISPSLCCELGLC